MDSEERHQLFICFICQLGFPMEQVNVGVCYEFISLGGMVLFFENILCKRYIFLPRLAMDSDDDIISIGGYM